MSHYIERYCSKHGEWEMDVDACNDCPDCVKEGSDVHSRLVQAEKDRDEAQKALVLAHFSCCSDGGCDMDCPGRDKADEAFDHLVDSMRKALYDTRIKNNGLEKERDALRSEAERLSDSIKDVHHQMVMVRPYFRSGNSVDVDRATVPQEKWMLLESAIEKALSGGGVP